MIQYGSRRFLFSTHFFPINAVTVVKFKHVLGVTRLLLHACCYIYSFCCWRLFIPPAVKSETYFSALFRIMFMWKNDQTVFVSFPPIDCLTVKKVIRLFSNEKLRIFNNSDWRLITFENWTSLHFSINNLAKHSFFEVIILRKFKVKRSNKTRPILFY